MKLHELVHVVSLEHDEDPDFVFTNLAVIRDDQCWRHRKAGKLWQTGQQQRPLTLELEFNDQFMRLDCVAHYPIWLLFFSESLSQLEQEILSEGGYFNPFTTYTCAFVDGKLQRFKCFYRNEHGIEHQFDKAKQMEISDFGGVYRDRRLQWLEENTVAAPADGT